MMRTSTAPKQNRCGLSLLETMLCVAVSGVMMSLGMGTLHLLLGSKNTMTSTLQRSRTVSQISRNFRNDIQAARTAELAPDQKTLTLGLGGKHRVAYSVEDSNVHRKETQGESVLQTNTFPFSPGSVISFSQNSQKPNQPMMWTLTINRPNSPRKPTTSDAVLRELTFQAILGKNQRFESEQ